MILDFDIELKDLESQPVWIGVDLRIKELVEEKNKLTARFEKDPREWINRRLNELEKDIELFKSIISFWGVNYKKMEYFKFKFEENAKQINHVSSLLETIEDQKMIIEDSQKLIVASAQMVYERLQDEHTKSGLMKVKNISNELYKKCKQRINEKA